MIKLIYLIAYVFFCVWFAYINAKQIANGYKIKHFWNGLVHVSAALTFAYFKGWQYGLSIILLARVCFDWSLNLFRGLPLDYLPMKPKSIADKIEKELFGGNGLIGKLLCILFIVILLSV